MERGFLFIKGVFRRMKIITARCKQCGKDFKCYGKYNSTLTNCNVHTLYKKEKK